MVFCLDAGRGPRPRGRGRGEALLPPGAKGHSQEEQRAASNTVTQEQNIILKHNTTQDSMLKRDRPTCLLAARNTWYSSHHDFLTFNVAVVLPLLRLRAVLFTAVVLLINYYSCLSSSSSSPMLRRLPGQTEDFTGPHTRGLHWVGPRMGRRWQFWLSVGRSFTKLSRCL